jgi:hypothetical protein
MRRLSPWRRRMRQTPLWLMPRPPHCAWARLALILRGPSPGWAMAKARTRASMTGLVWLGMRGERRSRGRSISRPEASTIAFQR